jgi:hypothetical protein
VAGSEPRAGCRDLSVGTQEGQNLRLTRFAEHGFQQANGIALAKPRRCNNCCGGDFVSHLRLAGMAFFCRQYRKPQSSPQLFQDRIFQVV